MRKTIILLAAALLAAFPGFARAELKIVTTTSDLASMARSVGGDHVRVESLQNGQQDPHFLQAKPSYIIKAKNADLWIRVGMELEIGYEAVILDTARNPRIRPGQPGHLDASATVLVLEKPAGRVDRSMGDVHPEGNPHYWLDPYNGRQVARAICKRLKLLDGAHRADYDANCAAFTRRLDEAMFGPELVAAVGGDRLWEAELQGTLPAFLEGLQLTGTLAGWKARMQPCAGRKVVTFHRSWPYLLQRFGLLTAAELEPKPGIPPGPAHVAEVVAIMRAQQARVILMEPFYPASDARAVADKASAVVVVAANATGGQPEAKDYLAMLDNAVNRLAGGLEQGGR